MKNIIYSNLTVFLLAVFCFQIAYAESYYTIQLASFQELGQARDLVKNLEQQDLDTYIIKSNLGAKGTWYRVRYGKFASQEVGTRYSEDLKNRSIDNFLAKFDLSGFIEGEIQEVSSLQEIDENAYTHYLDTTIQKDTHTVVQDTSEEDDDEIIIPDKNSVFKDKDIEETDEKEINKEFEDALHFANLKFEKAFKENSPTRFREALEAFKKMLNDYIGEKDLYRVEYMIAECYVNLGQYDPAIKILRDIVKETEPGIAAAIQYEIGYIYYHHKREYYEAVKELSTITVDYPDSVWAREAQNLIDTIMQYKIFKE